MPWQLSPTEFVSMRLGWICHNLFPSVQIMEKRGLRTWYTEFKWIEFTQTWLFCYQATTLITYLGWNGGGVNWIPSPCPATRSELQTQGKQIPLHAACLSPVFLSCSRREYAIIEWCTRPDTRQTKLLALILHLSYKTRVKFLPFITILLKTTKLLKVLLKFLNVAFTSCAFTFRMFDYISGVTCRSPNTVHYLL